VARSRALGLANAVGRGLARIGIRASLEGESLFRAARRYTRLSDFGDEEFREPLRRLLDAHENEGRLSPTGRALRRLSFVDMLSSRLRVQRQIARDPKLLHEPPRSPLVVTGLPRTGTTLLQRLLSLDPDARPLRAWEAMWPAPLGRTRSGEDSRIRHARRLVWLTRRFLPGIDAIHPLDPEGPEECTRLLESSFRWDFFAIESRLPGYAAWMREQGPDFMVPAYRWYATQLQVLQGRGPAGRWVLKSPAHVGNLRSLLEVLPAARVVVTIRDPRETVASACSLFGLLYGTTADDPRTSGIGPGVAASLAAALTRGLETAALEPERIRVVRYEDLIGDPLGTLAGIHAGFGIPFPPELEEAARAWLAANPQGRHGVHAYDLESYGLDEESVLRLFAGAELAMSRIGLSSRK
jgi:hypothetical protein